jgi:hypothetical protein
MAWWGWEQDLAIFDDKHANLHLPSPIAHRLASPAGRLPLRALYAADDSHPCGVADMEPQAPKTCPNPNEL